MVTYEAYVHTRFFVQGVMFCCSLKAINKVQLSPSCGLSLNRNGIEVAVE